jgi:Protein of unknown function (DUF3892)
VSEYRIVCTTKSKSSPAATHGHITSVKVGQGVATGATWQVSTVRFALDRGDTFYTEGGGRKALVEKWSCCGVETIRTKPDETKINNLDNLPAC